MNATKRIKSRAMPRITRDYAPRHPQADEEGCVSRCGGLVVHTDEHGRRYVLEPGGARGESFRRDLDPEPVLCSQCDNEVEHEEDTLCPDCARDAELDEAEQSGPRDGEPSSGCDPWGGR